MNNYFHPRFINNIFIAILLVLAPSVTLADGYTPNAGSILQEIKPRLPIEPASKDIGLTIEKAAVKKLPCEPSDKACVDPKVEGSNPDKTKN
jgi:hypothetical protein